MVILVDDEDRENEGDLFVAAERATPEAINFMATHGRGLISLALTEERMRAARPCRSSPTTRQHARKFQTAFATPIDAREGVGSGMSAHDRARTIAVAIAEGTRPGRSHHARAGCRRCARSTAACSRAAGIPKPRSILRAWRD